MTLFIYSTFDEQVKKKIRRQIEDFGTVVFNSETGGTGKDVLKEYEVLLGNPPRAWLDPFPPNLKFWQLDSAGFNQYQNITTKAVVANMGDFFSRPCAETMMAGIIGFYRLIPLLAKLQLQKRWIGTPLRAQMDVLSGKKVLILGAGTIATALQKMLRGFDCTVDFMARTSKGDHIFSIEDIMQNLDSYKIVINALPGNAEGLVSESFFQKMSPETLYASVGRGNTTDQAALIRALSSEKLLGAVLDVTETEPIPDDHVFWTMPNVILTQHTGGGQKFEDEGKVNMFLLNLENFINGLPVQNRVELKKGY